MGEEGKERNIKPIWEQVDKAISFFISDWKKEERPPRKRVRTPTKETKKRKREGGTESEEARGERKETQGSEESKEPKRRYKRKSPAVTIVAACKRAETGVGPAMASESQGWKKI